MTFKSGDLVLLVFPFSSATGAKQRPALVLIDTGDEDLLVARVTTQRHTTKYDVAIQRWKAAGLVAPSTVRIHKLATIEKRIARKKLGRLDALDWSAARADVEATFCEK